MITKETVNKNISLDSNNIDLKNSITPIRIKKKIEIVIVPKFKGVNSHQDNVIIILEEKKILRILSKRYNNVQITEINCEKDLEMLAKRKPDLVFSGVTYFLFNGKKIWLNDYLEIFSIPYIASSKVALNIANNKNLAKKIIQKLNIKTADFFVTNPGEYLNESSIPINFPLFIKPLTGGDSRGVDKNSIVFNFDSFTSKVLDIKTKQNSPSLVETYLSGKEYSVGIFENNVDGSLRAMPIEIIVKKNVDGNCILDFNVKNNDEEKVILVTNAKIFKQLSKLAKDSFKAIGGKSFGRIDIKMNQFGVPHFLEANLMPGIRKGYFYRSCLLNLEMNYEDMIYNIANTGLTSHQLKI